jgi:outer membrane biosynthesis protein TonB
MAYTTYMTDNFESEKNMKASAYTAMVCVLLLVVFLFVKWTLPSIPPPPIDEGIEVNLGNSDEGMGDDQPFSPGKPAPSQQQEYTPPKQAVADNTDVKDFETDDKDEEAPAIVKPPVTKPKATRVPEKEVVKNKPVTTTQPVTNPTPPAPKPKAVFKGVNGTGTGGNEADTYKKGGNQGVAGGSGDQGRPGGNPDSDNYTGNGGTGKSGVSKLRGLSGRNIIRRPSFEDEFNENAKVAIDIRVDAAGNVVSAEFQPRGSTTSDASMIEIAKRKARQVKFNAGTEESTGTIQFNFRLRS